MMTAPTWLGIELQTHPFSAFVEDNQSHKKLAVKLHDTLEDEYTLPANRDKIQTLSRLAIFMWNAVHWHSVLTLFPLNYPI